MPTLSAMFRLMDGYSSSIKKILDNTDKAAASIFKASKETDKYNDALKRTASSADVASAGLSRLIGTVASLAAAKKGMDLTDTYTNTSARLSMITDSMEEQKQLQRDIFAAANRSRGSYIEMANASAKLKMLAGDTFGSNLEAVGFSELLTKSLKVSGAGKAEQNSAFLQLTQAMTSGKLQGDEFRSVMENAPMVADAIAKYMGKSKSELKDLSSKGVITADIIKGAMFNAADEINDKFAKMPPTFADTWEQIKNAGLQAFGGVFDKVNGLLNSEGVQTALNNLIGGIYMAGSATEQFIDFCTAAWPYVSPFIYSAVAALSVYAGAQLVSNALTLISNARTGAQAVYVGLLALSMWATTDATWAETTAQLGLNSALYACPVMWVVGMVFVLIAAFYAGVAAVNHFAGTSISATGLIGAAFFTAWAFIYNNFVFPMQSGFTMLANFIGNVFHSPTAAVKILFLQMAQYCVNRVVEMAKSIEGIINKIPGVQVDFTSGLGNLQAGLEAKISSIKDESGWTEYIKEPQKLDYGEMAAKGYTAGSGLADKVSHLFTGAIPSMEGTNIDFGNFATDGSPATIKGKGKDGAVKIESENVDWLRKLAERDYVARISQNTLAPNIQVTFTGDIRQEMDYEKIGPVVADILQDEIDAAPEGLY